MFRLFSHNNIRSSLLLLVLAGLVLGSMSSYAKVTSYQTKLIIHKNSSGEKGRDVITLPACYQNQSAVLKFKKRRFGHAKILRVKCADKKQCSATVEWKHKPAGRIEYYIRYKSASRCN